MFSDFQNGIVHSRHVPVLRDILKPCGKMIHFRLSVVYRIKYAKQFVWVERVIDIETRRQPTLMLANASTHFFKLLLLLSMLNWSVCL